MKNELDRQLKAKWEAATLKELDLDIDTEKLWQKIDKPATDRKRSFSGLKYAAAVFSGAVITLLLTQLNTPKDLAMKPLMQVRKNSNAPAVSGQAGTPQTIVRNQTVTQVAVAVKSDLLTDKPPTTSTTSLAKTSKTAVPLNGNAQPGNSPIQGSVQTPVFLPETNTIARETPKAALKTVHLSDLENPAPEPVKPNKFMMAVGEHIHPKSNDIAFSTKILTKQF